jgi:hypothetical protein
MTTPQQLSYTMIVKALLYKESYFLQQQIALKPFIKPTNAQNALVGGLSYEGMSYYYKIFVLFQKFFTDISNFPNFIKHEEAAITKSENSTGTTESRNYFARLLNSLAHFLDEHGNINNLSNVPWIKLPGATDWQIVNHMDDNVLVITDVMMKAKKFEQTFKRQSLPDVLKKLNKNKESLLREKADIATKINDLQKIPTKSTTIEKELQQHQAQLKRIDRTLPAIETALRDFEERIKPSIQQGRSAITRKLEERWKEWDAQRKTVSQPSQEIDATEKDLIFTTVNNVYVPLNFGTTDHPKAIIPLTQPTSPDINLTRFDNIHSDDPFTTFFNFVLKPIKPLTAIPHNTLILINKLTCNNDILTATTKKKVITLNKCLIPFGVEELQDYDCYFSYNNRQFGIKRQPSGSLEIKKISLGNKLINATLHNCTTLIDALLEIGADVDAQNKAGNTALIVAARKGQIDLVKKLLNADADPTIKNKDGKAALDLAHKYPEIQALIQQAIENNLIKKSLEEEPENPPVLMPAN